MGEFNGSETLDVGNNFRDFVMGLNEYKSDKDLASIHLFSDYPESLLQFASACCIIFTIIGIPGNLITVIALARCRKVRNATAIFIINLSLSDLLFCCFNLPLAASTFSERSWKHGIFLCRMFPLARYALVAVSLFTILAITVNRYIMISHPSLYPKLYKNLYLYIMIASIWIVSFGSLMATFFEVWGRFSLDKITGSCTIVPDERHTSPKKFLFIAAFVLPSAVIIVCYVRILWIVRKASKKSRSPIQMQPVSQMNVNIPETVLSSTADETIQKRDKKSRLTIPCFYSPELSTYNDSSSREDDKNSPELKSSPLNSESARRFRKSFMINLRQSTANIKPRMPTRKDKKLLTMIVAIITTFCICHLPITLTKTIVSQFSPHPYLNIFGYVLLYMTTCINPIIYVVMSSEYRQAYKNLFKCSR